MDVKYWLPTLLVVCSVQNESQFLETERHHKHVLLLSVIFAVGVKNVKCWLLGTKRQNGLEGWSSAEKNSDSTELVQRGYPASAVTNSYQADVHDLCDGPCLRNKLNVLSRHCRSFVGCYVVANRIAFEVSGSQMQSVNTRPTG